MLAKERIKRSFAKASASYDPVATLQRQVGRGLLEGVGRIPAGSTTVDLGCGTGFICAEILQRQAVPPDRILAIDIALPMLQMARQKLNGKPVDFICADAENLPLPSQSVDLVLSNLALQWCQDLGRTIGCLHRALRPGGTLAFTTFGRHTLAELKAAWQEVDAYNHVNEFIDEESLAAHLAEAGFVSANLSSERHLVRYDSVMALLRELKQLGAHSVVNGQQRQLTGKRKIQQMMAAYHGLDACAGINATFEVITVIARK